MVVYEGHDWSEEAEREKYDVKLDLDPHCFHSLDATPASVDAFRVIPADKLDGF